MVSFDINGSIIKFDEKREEYNTIRKNFKEYGEEYRDIFVKYCLENVTNIRQINGKHLEYAQNMTDEVIRKGVETLIRYNILTIDFDLFKENYCKKYLNFEKYFKSITRDLPNANNKKNTIKIFDIKPIVNKLSEYLYNDCFNIHKAILDALIENGVTSVNSYIDKKSIGQSIALFNNYKDGFINKLDGSKVIQKIIMSNPYRQEVYEFFIKEDGDFTGDIQRLADYLGFNVVDFKSSLMDEYIETLVNEGIKDIESSKEKIRKYAKYIGYEDCSIFITRIDAIYTFADA